MPEPPIDDERHVERQVVYENVSSTSTRSSTVTFVVVLVIALALIAWVASMLW